MHIFLSSELLLDSLEEVLLKVYVVSLGEIGPEQPQVEDLRRESSKRPNFDIVAEGIGIMDSESQTLRQLLVYFKDSVELLLCYSNSTESERRAYSDSFDTKEYSCELLDLSFELLQLCKELV
jgi:hypothetical protein